MAKTVQISAEFTGLQSSLEKQIAAATRGQGVKIPVNDQAFNQAFTGMTANVRRFEQSLDISNRRVIAFGTSAAIVYGAVRGFKELVETTVQVEKTLTSINSIFGLTTRQLDTFSKSLFNVARQTGQAFDEVAEAAQEFSRQGLGVEETLKRTRDAMILVRLTGLDTTKAVSTLTAAVNTFSRAGENSTSILNKVVAADQKFAVSARDIAEAFQRVGSVVDDAGVSIDQFIGLVTAAKQITSRDGAVIGNSLKTILTRLERSTTLDDLEALGIAVRDTAGAAKPALEVFNELAKSYNTLGREQQNLVAQLGGGVFQINQFKALLLDLGKASGVASQAERVSAQATNQALIRNAALNDTLATSIQNLKTSATETASIVGELTFKPVIKQGIEAGGILNSLFGNLSKSGDTKAAEDFGAYIGESILKGIGNVLAGPGIVFAARAVTGVIRRTVPEITGDIRASASLANVQVGRKGTLGSAIIGGLTPAGESEAIARTNALLAQGTKEEQARYAAASAVAEREAVILGIMERQAVIAAELAGVQRTAGARIANEEALLSKGGSVFNLRGRRRTPFGASGYLPVGEEASAISQGIGGAPSSARPVFLGGFRRPDGQGIVANTSEFIVPGAAGGYPAIYNRDMIQKLGLPPGSTPVAAGGYVPNAANSYNVPPSYRSGPTNPVYAFGVNPNTPPPYIPGESAPAGGQGFGQLLALQKQVLDKDAANAAYQARILAQQEATAKGEAQLFAAERARQESDIRRKIFVNGVNAYGERATQPNEPIPFETPPSGTLAGDPSPTTGSTRRGISDRERAAFDAVLAQRRAKRAQAIADQAAVQRSVDRQRLNSSLQTSLLVGSFASAFLPTGTSGQLSGELSGAASGGLNGGALGGNIGSIFGPVGGFIGAGIGGIGGAIKGFVSRMTKSFEEVAADIEKDNAKLKAQTEAVSQAFALQDRLIEGRERGIKGPLVARTQRELSSNLAQITDPKLRAFVLAGDQQGAAQYQFEQQERASTQQAIKLSFTKAITGGDYGRDTVASAASGLQSSFVGLSDQELAKVLNDIRTPTAAAATGLKNSEGLSLAGRLGLNMQAAGAAGGAFGPLLGRIGSLISGGAIANAGTFTQDATIKAINAEIQRRADERQADIVAKGNAGSYISRLQALQLSSQIGVAGQIGQIQAGGVLQIAQARQGFALEGPGLSELQRARLEGQFGRANIVSQAATSRAATLATGKSALIQSLGDAGVRDRALIERIGGISDQGGLQSLQQDLTSILTSKAPEGTLAKAQDAIKELVDRLTVLNATEQESIKVNDTTNSLLREQILKRQDVGFVTSNLRQSLQDQGRIQRAQDQAVVNLAGNPETSDLISGSALAGAKLSQANRAGAKGKSVESLARGFESVFAGARQEAKNFAEVGAQVANSLGNNFSQAFGDFVTSTKKAKDAFRDFIVSVLADSARAFATKAVTSLLGAFFGNIAGGFNTGSVSVGTPTSPKAAGGFINRASGGPIPTMLTGGEFVYPPTQAARIGGRMLKAVNSGSVRAFAPGGLVRGGSGVADDVFQPLAAGSFVVRKAMVERYGANNLASLSIGGYPDMAAGAPVTALHLATGGSAGVASSMMASPTPVYGAPSGGGGVFTIGVNITDNSTTTQSSPDQGGGSIADKNFGAILARRIKETTLQVMQEQQRPGGINYRPSYIG